MTLFDPSAFVCKECGHTPAAFRFDNQPEQLCANCIAKRMKPGVDYTLVASESKVEEEQ